jgi:integrase
VRQWIANLDDQGYAPATIRKAYQLLSAAVEDGLLPRSPARGVTLPRMERPEMHYLTAAQVAEVAAAIAPRYEVLVLTAAYTGLRFGELAALRVNRLDMLKRSLRVVENLSEIQGHFAVGPVKSKASRRTVTMPSFLVERLASHITAYPEDSGVVFGAPEGGPIRRTNFRRRHWLPAVRSTVGDGVRFHDLRHTHAALLIAEGIHPKVIQERLGHASIRTTLDTYGHLFEGLDGEAADALDNAFQRSDVDRMWIDQRSRVVEFH